MNQFLISVLSAEDPTGKKSCGDIMYKGDDYQEAQKTAARVVKNPDFRGRTLRYVNYALFGGGIKDTPIAA